MTTTVSLDHQAHQPELEIYVLLRQINAMLEMFNRYDLRGEDLTVPQFAILNHATTEGVALSEISARMLCDNSNLTGIVDRLIAKGLVERRPDRQDRRVSLICLTPQGAEKLQTIRPQHQGNVVQRMHMLAQSEVENLRNLLDRLHQGLANGLEDERQQQTITSRQALAIRQNANARQNGSARPNGSAHPNGSTHQDGSAHPFTPAARSRRNSRSVDAGQGVAAPHS